MCTAILMHSFAHCFRFPGMARGGLHGTYYVPEAPSYVTILDVPLNQHEKAIAQRVARTYEVKFIKACFTALQTCTQFNVDCFFTNNNVDLNIDNTLLTQGQLCASVFKHHVTLSWYW